MATKKHTPTIYVVSDGRGDTCTQLVDAALIQFEKPHARIVRQSNVRTARRVETIVRKAAEAHAIIFYTLVGLIFLLIIWPALAISVKRWHDRDKSGWWVLIGLVPLIGGLWALIETGFLPGTEGDNQYGPDPLAG